LNPVGMSDHELADGIRQGSPDAFRALYEAQGRAVLAFLTRMTGRKEMAEELTQEVFLTAIRKIAFFKAGPDGGLRAWVFRIASNLAVDSLRHEKRIRLSAGGENASEEIDLRPGAHDELERFEFSNQLALALLELTDLQRMVFILKEQEEMSLLEISRVCGSNENSIKQNLFRARAALRKLLCK
jgi:RNA polymerase sigma-70 factor (ECF subfamily)